MVNKKKWILGGGISISSIIALIVFLADSASIIKKLIKDNDEAITILDPTNRKMALDEIFEIYHKEVMKKGWKVTYELVKNRIYGEDHYEAFKVLKEATVLAINKGESKDMLDRINADKNGVLWKLSHGHPEQWNPIIETLINNESDHH